MRAAGSAESWEGPGLRTEGRGKGPAPPKKGEVAWEADGQRHVFDPAAGPSKDGPLPEPDGPRRDYQDAIRCIFFRGRGEGAAEVARRVGRPQAWVEARWASEAERIAVPRQLPPYVQRYAMRCLAAGTEPFRPAELRRGFAGTSPDTLRALSRFLPWKAAPVLKRNYTSGQVSDTGVRVARQMCSPPGLRTGVPSVDRAIRQIQEEFAVTDPCAYLLCNKYPDGKATIAPHQHDFWSATLSFGAPRVFVLDRQPLLLQEGDLLVFGSQRHTVPRMPGLGQERVSISLFWYPDWQPEWYSEDQILQWRLQDSDIDAWSRQRAADVETLRGLGFSEFACLEALDQAQEDVDAAAALLLDGGRPSEVKPTVAAPSPQKPAAQATRGPTSPSPSKSKEGPTSPTSPASPSASKTKAASKTRSPSPKKTASKPQSEAKGYPSEEPAPPTAEPALTLPAVKPSPKKKSPAPKKKPDAKKATMTKTASEGNLAHSLLMNAPMTYEDHYPGRAEFAPNPPKQKVPASPPMPQQGSTKEVLGAAMRSQSTGKIERKSYGGKLVGGQFIRTKAENIDDMSEADKQACLADIAASKEAKKQEIAERAKMHKAMKKKLESQKQDKFKEQMGAAEAEEEERRSKKMKELKKWLKKKDDETKAKKKREADMMAEIMEKEQKKAEQLRLVEQQRLAEREKRLKMADKQKQKLEQHMRSSMTSGGDPMDSAASLSGPMQFDARLSGSGGMGMAGSAQQRVVHRHVHHHVHYHDSDEEGNVTGEGWNPAFAASLQEQRQLEMQTEARLRAQMEAGFPPHQVIAQSASAPLLHRPPLPQVDAHAHTPKRLPATQHELRDSKRHNGPLPPMDDDEMRLTRTQEAFRPALPAFNRNIQRATGAYADSGRPQRIRQGNFVQQAFSSH